MGFNSAFKGLIHSLLFMILLYSVMCRNIRSSLAHQKVAGKTKFYFKDIFIKKIVTNFVIKCYYACGYMWIRIKFRFLYANSFLLHVWQKDLKRVAIPDCKILSHFFDTSKHVSSANKFLLCKVICHS